MSSSEVNYISTKTVHHPTSPSHTTTPYQQIHLSPWDLKLLKAGAIRRGLLYHYQLSEPPPPPPTTTTTTTTTRTTTTSSISSIIDGLETSLSLTLHHFFPLAGRLTTTTHDDGTISVYIECNNAGAELIHAIAPNATVADIKNPVVVPNIVSDLFALNGALNYDQEIPLLAVQATELVDGIFIGITMNHVAADGTSFWHFVNTWSEICRRTKGSDHLVLAHDPPVSQRWFPDDIRPPIRLRFAKEHHCKQLTTSPPMLQPLPLTQRVFHFSLESIARLKAKANVEQPKTLNNTPIKISSLQAVLSHIWLGVTRARRLPSDEETSYVLMIGNRPRLVPPLPKQYSGNAVNVVTVVAKAEELLEHGIGWAAAQFNQEINSHDDAAIRSGLSSWVRKPQWPSLADFFSKSVLLTGSSPRFNVYGNDFGWGRPVAVRSGGGNKFNGKITVFEGCVEGSMDFEACLAVETLEALVDDAEFMREVTTVC
ncbi:hypothetical protein Syun_015268 [Stephania yunnanensis]|uniref:HXXXD-type acyl-transferase family protein n=1 Tax=Stephania yunnanensis TaxID=152371 RepID=A0AAP0P977_9MAGN